MIWAIYTKLEKIFRKNIAAVSFFKLCYTLIFLIHIFFINRPYSRRPIAIGISRRIFPRYTYYCPIKFGFLNKMVGLLHLFSKVKPNVSYRDKCQNYFRTIYKCLKISKNRLRRIICSVHTMSFY